MRPTTFTTHADTGDLPMHDVVQLHHRMFISRNYDWWREVGEDDVVVDIGAGVGLFSCKALDVGAKKVYMIEPSKSLMKTAIKNVSDHMLGKLESPIIPINAAIGKTDVDRGNVFGSKKQPPGTPDPDLISFRELREKYEIKEINFLKVAAEGAEFNILTDDDLDFFATKVRHIAVVVHMKAQYGSAQKFARWRDSFLKPFIELNRVKFQDDSIRNKMFQSDYKDVLPERFMIYITNW